MLFILIIACVCNLYAQQGNYKYNNFGNRSILLSGNVTGSVDDIGLIYYNPSRLTRIKTSGFSFNAKAYQYNISELESFIDEADPLKNDNFSGVPSIAGGTFLMFGERFAYTYLSRQRNRLNLSTRFNNLSNNILELFPEAQNSSFKTSIDNELRDDWYGLAWAKEINKNLSLGLSVFGSYFNYSGKRLLNQTLQFDENNVAFYLLDYKFQQTSYGINIKVGASYKLKQVDIGINIGLPYLQLFSGGEFSYEQINSGTNTDSDSFYFYDFNKLDSELRNPLSISIGAGVDINKGRIHLNLDYVSQLKEYARIDIPTIDLGSEVPTQILFNDQRRAIINFGLGGELELSKKFKSYFGFSTDFNAFDETNNFFSLTSKSADDIYAGTNFYHFSGGVDWKLNWANIIFGVTYSSGTNSIGLPSDITSNVPTISENAQSRLKTQRIQLVIGLEIPFIDKSLKTLKSPFN